MNAITPVSQSALVETQALPLDQNPAAVYLAGLKPSGRYTQRQMLNLVAGKLHYPDALTCPSWGSVYAFSMWQQSGPNWKSSTSPQP